MLELGDRNCCCLSMCASPSTILSLSLVLLPTLNIYSIVWYSSDFAKIHQNTGTIGALCAMRIVLSFHVCLFFLRFFFGFWMHTKEHVRDVRWLGAPRSITSIVCQDPTQTHAVYKFEVFFFHGAVLPRSGPGPSHIWKQSAEKRQVSVLLDSMEWSHENVWKFTPFPHISTCSFWTPFKFKLQIWMLPKQSVFPQPAYMTASKARQFLESWSFSWLIVYS